jgi:D-3-phosphoglycerate dehydrogenase / 2-oxoglutarate reductase
MHQGVWDKSADGAHEIRGRRLGIVGYGNIGTQLSVLAENLGLHVSFYDTADKLALSNAHRCASMEELLETSDIVTLHVDGRPGNLGFFGAEQFKRMRRGTIFLNLSRGIVVDHLALRDALASNHLAGAAVDVYPTEPKGRGDEFVSELRGLPNVILTPHIGGSTEEAQSDIGDFVANKLTHFVEDGNTTLSVNLPGVALPEQPGMSRTIHVHINMPGVLAQVNSILAEHKVNVEGQLLSTRGEYGYLITDISGGFSDEVLDRLRAMEQTVRLRVLS